MSVPKDYNNDYIGIAKDLVSSLESNDHSHANKLLNKLCNTNDSVIFQEIGKLTRDLHDTLKGFEIDIEISELANTGIPDAKKRLNYVIEKTQEAADKTMSIAEKHIPDCEGLEIESKILSCDWERFMSKDMGADDFRVLAKRLTKYFDDNKSSYKGLIDGMNDIIMAQSYQDITGQVIKKVISLVQEVEDNLIRVIKVTGELTGENTESESGELVGPIIAGVNDSSEMLSSQDEVDDLLSSMGF